MDGVLAVRFKKTGKLTYINPLKFGFRIGDQIIANTERGEEIGRVVKLLDKSEVPQGVEIMNIIKPATKNDLQIQKDNEAKAKLVEDFCKKEVQRLGLKMKILLAEYTFDSQKISIYFVSEERIDFRELVKILANEYRVRIELRQVGPRDEIKTYQNLGMCGKETCCRTFLDDFEPVTIKMAKEQGLQINMQKLSGACGRLMCCLQYEEEAYKENLKKLPKLGSIVRVGKESGKVVSTDILNLKVKVKFGMSKEEERYETYLVQDVNWDKTQEHVEDGNEEKE